MNNVNFTITRESVYNEVAKTTSYGGKKAQGDENAYQRMRTTPEDEEMLQRFWHEACDMITSMVKPFINSVSDDTDFNLSLAMPSRYDTTLNAMLQATAFSFIVNQIIAKWYDMANKDEARKYDDTANGLATKFKATVFYRKKPTLIQDGNTEKQ